MEPKLRICIVDKAGGEIANVETDVVSLPDHPAFKDQSFKGFMDALAAIYESNPNLGRIQVDVVGEKEAHRL